MSYSQSVNAEDHATADLIQFLKFASVSTDPAFKTQVDECADWLVIKLKGMGLTSKNTRRRAIPSSWRKTSTSPAAPR